MRLPNYFRANKLLALLYALALVCRVLASAPGNQGYTLVTWGSGNYGGDAAASVAGTTVDHFIASPESLTAVSTSGSLLMWGHDDARSPSTLTPVSNVVDVVGGQFALRADGSVVALDLTKEYTYTDEQWASLQSGVRSLHTTYGFFCGAET
jgi:hypothetical protein